MWNWDEGGGSHAKCFDEEEREGRKKKKHEKKCKRKKFINEK